MSRNIVQRTRGHAGGPLTRLVSPPDLRQLLNPFVFLDLFDFRGGHAPPLEFGWHLHSGIAIVTVVFDGAVQFTEATGRAGMLPAGGVEWMQAGGGVWHTGTVGADHVKGFQLWVALPPPLENVPTASHYLLPEQVPGSGPVRAVLGAYGGLESPLPAPSMTYLALTLRDGERWTFTPPAGHGVAWAAVLDGALEAPAPIGPREVAVFERSEGPIAFASSGETRFVLGSAPLHPHELVLGSYSVHTSTAALALGETEIRRTGPQFRAEGRQSYALGFG